MTTDEETRTTALEMGRGLGDDPANRPSAATDPAAEDRAEPAEDGEADRPLSTADVAAAGRTPVAVADPSPPRAGGSEIDADESERTPLLSDELAEAFRSRWQDVQADFVDDPPSAVERADALVAEVMQRLADTFARERAGLERQWSGGGQASTEDLRIAVQRYRSFFQRLLSL
jgi:hypothetical protein